MRRPTKTTMRRRHQLTVLLLFVAKASGLGVSSNQYSRNHGDKSSSLILPLIRRAMLLSTLSSNMTAAEEGCIYWKELLLNNYIQLSSLTSGDDKVLGLCRAMYASCLVRTGKDEDAIPVFNQALQLANFMDMKTKRDVILGKAGALQRLLRYEEAKKTYLQSVSEQGIMGAVTCSLRLAEPPSVARKILTNFLESSETTDHYSGVGGMLGTLQYLGHDISTKQALDFFHGDQNIPLYRWIYCVLAESSSQKQFSIELVVQDPLLDFIKINLCPFDDPSLVLLDDKINLHRTLAEAPEMTSSFWPKGIATTAAVTDIQNIIDCDMDNSSWIAKQRAGYGSHGNRIISFNNVRDLVRKQQLQSDEVLIQKMVEPPFLFDNRKFSLRIYIIYFTPDEVYISSQGLVKMASMVMSQNDEFIRDARVHMTNSGREVSMIQKDLTYLKSKFDSLGLCFEDFWCKIRTAVDVVFQLYKRKKCRQTQPWDARRSALGIPKVMGFDFVVDSSCNPWLVEVNRFPGLEPRDESDRIVKWKVIHDAWTLAGDRMKMLKAHPLRGMLDKLQCADLSSSVETL